MSRLCRLKCNSHGEDGKWAYDEIVSLRKARDQLIEQFKTVLDENKTLKSALHHEADVAESYKAEADSLRKDAERYKVLAEYLVSSDTSWDDAIVACNTVGELSVVLDSMKG